MDLHVLKIPEYEKQVFMMASVYLFGHFKESFLGFGKPFSEITQDFVTTNCDKIAYKEVIVTFNQNERLHFTNCKSSSPLRKYNQWFLNHKA